MEWPHRQRQGAEDAAHVCSGNREKFAMPRLPAELSHQTEVAGGEHGRGHRSRVGEGHAKKVSLACAGVAGGGRLATPQHHPAPLLSPPCRKLENACLSAYCQRHGRKGRYKEVLVEGKSMSKWAGVAGSGGVVCYGVVGEGVWLSCGRNCQTRKVPAVWGRKEGNRQGKFKE